MPPPEAVPNIRRPKFSKPSAAITEGKRARLQKSALILCNALHNNLFDCCRFVRGSKIGAARTIRGSKGNRNQIRNAGFSQKRNGKRLHLT